jgi:hypothetical protein
MTDLKIVVVPKELYYHEVAYVRGLETAARAMLAALKEKKRVDGNANRTLPEIEAANRAAYFAIAQAEAAGITAQP